MLSYEIQPFCGSFVAQIVLFLKLLDLNRVLNNYAFVTNSGSCQLVLGEFI